MGQLSYAGDSQIVEVDDRVLAHLRLVTVTKLRRGESFPLTLRTAGAATETLWMHASIPVRFTLDEDVELERPMLVKMMAAASTAGGAGPHRHRLRAAVVRAPDHARGRLTADSPPSPAHPGQSGAARGREVHSDVSGGYVAVDGIRSPGIGSRDRMPFDQRAVYPPSTRW
ncbi:hypothetical protein [Microbacterium oxydans]|uniref:DUF7882 family protein n=1 Tax=Microbacterium oxydans TaxID=82380 RepID=UPI003D808E13